MAYSPISKFAATGKNARFLAHLNKVIERLNALSATSSPGDLTSQTTKGVTRRPKVRSSSGGSTDDGVWL